MSDNVVMKEGEWSLTHFGYILNVEQVEFADGFNNGCERGKKEGQDLGPEQVEKQSSH